MSRNGRLIGSSSARRSLHRDVGYFASASTSGRFAHRPRLVPLSATEVIEDSAFEVGCRWATSATFGRKSCRPSSRSGRAGPLRCRPQPVNGAVRRHLLCSGPMEGEAGSRACPGLLHVSTARGSRACRGGSCRGREPIGVAPRCGLHAELRSRLDPRRVRVRMAASTPPRLHLLQGMFFEIGGDLPATGWVGCPHSRDESARRRSAWRSFAEGGAV